MKKKKLPQLKGGWRSFWDLFFSNHPQVNCVLGWLRWSDRCWSTSDCLVGKDTWQVLVTYWRWLKKKHVQFGSPFGEKKTFKHTSIWNEQFGDFRSFGLIEPRWFNRLVYGWWLWCVVYCGFYWLGCFNIIWHSTSCFFVGRFHVFNGDNETQALCTVDGGEIGESFDMLFIPYFWYL